MNKKILKSTLNVLMAFVLFSSCYAQEVNEVEKKLDSVALKMFENVNERDYDAIMEMTHPKVFDLVPKEMMVNVFKSMFEGNEEFTIDIPKVVPEYHLSEIFKDEENDGAFAFVHYDMEMSMTFHKKEEYDDESKEMMVNMMKA